jgi:hypothetical protein
MAHPLGEEEAIGVGDDDPVILDMILEFDHVIEDFVEGADPADRFADRDHLAFAIHIDDRVHANQPAHRRGDAADPAALGEELQIVGVEIDGELIDFGFGPFLISSMDLPC